MSLGNPAIECKFYLLLQKQSYEKLKDEDYEFFSYYHNLS